MDDKTKKAAIVMGAVVILVGLAMVSKFPLKELLDTMLAVVGVF